MDSAENVQFKTIEEKSPKSSKKSNLKVAIMIAIILGIGTGIFLSKQNQKISVNGTPQIIETEKMIGSTAKNFKDDAEGILQRNDSKTITEGTHKLIRGDESQTVYLTSSVVDLDKYVGNKIKAWGETFKGQKAAWLMDVGKIEILQ